MFRPNFTTKTSGMGLGLAIVKNILLAARGDIWFKSEVNVGTSFFVKIPLYKEDEGQSV
jgi:signal transduction histidine kinase